MPPRPAAKKAVTVAPAKRKPPVRKAVLAEVAPVAAKPAPRARARKAVEEPEPPAPKGRKAPVKKPVAAPKAAPKPRAKRAAEVEEEPKPAPKGRKAPAKKAGPKLARLVDEPKENKRRDEGDRYSGFNLGEVPLYIKYELNWLYKNEKGALVDELRTVTWQSWAELYFSLEQFKKAKIRQGLSYEIYQNKVGAGGVGQKCRSCGRETVQVFMMQTRAGDEGTSAFGKCTNCGVIGKYY